MRNRVHKGAGASKWFFDCLVNPPGKCCSAQKNVAMHKICAYIPFLGARGFRARQARANERIISMAKMTDKTSETIEFPTFDASKATDQFRAFTEKGVEQSKDAYAKMKTNAEGAQKAIETSFETAKSVGNTMSLKTIAAMRANAEADFAHMEALSGVTSISDFFELQTSYLRKRVEMMVEQTKEMQSVTAKAAEEVSKPVKDVFEKSFKELKVA